MSSDQEVLEKKESSLEGITEGSWIKCKSALESLLADLVSPTSKSTLSYGIKGGEGPNADELRQLVTEAVSAVLLESDLLNKIVTRILRGLLKSDESLREELVSADQVRHICVETLRSFSLQTFGPILKKEINNMMQKVLKDLGNTEEFKDLLDSRFRTMEQYLRSDVVPHALKKALKENSA